MFNIPPVIKQWLQESFQRMAMKSPKFFRIWQIISGLCTMATGIPYLLVQFNITLPEPLASLSNKALLFFSAGAWFMAQFPIKNTVVPQPEGKLPFSSNKEPLILKNKTMEDVYVVYNPSTQLYLKSYEPGFSNPQWGSDTDAMTFETLAAAEAVADRIGGWSVWSGKGH